MRCKHMRCTPTQSSLYNLHASFDLAVAIFSIEAPGVEFLRPAHALCPPHLPQQVENVVESFNPNWLLPPMDGEVFDSFQECLTRL